MERKPGPLGNVRLRRGAGAVLRLSRLLSGGIQVA